MLGCLSRVGEDLEAGIFRPRADLIGQESLFAPRAHLARPLGVELCHHGPGARGEEACDVAEDPRWIIRVVQDHGDQGRIGMERSRVECQGVRDNTLDLGDAPLALEALQVSQGVSRPVHGVDQPVRPHTLCQDQADVARAGADVQHPGTRLKLERVQPRLDQAGAPDLAGEYLVQADMAQVFPVRLLHDEPLARIIRERGSRTMRASQKPLWLAAQDGSSLLGRLDTAPIPRDAGLLPGAPTTIRHLAAGMAIGM